MEILSTSARSMYSEAGLEPKFRRQQSHYAASAEVTEMQSKSDHRHRRILIVSRPADICVAIPRLQSTAETTFQAALVHG